MPNPDGATASDQPELADCQQGQHNMPSANHPNNHTPGKFRLILPNTSSPLKKMPGTPMSFNNPHIHSTPGKQYYTPGKPLSSHQYKTPTARVQRYTPRGCTPRGYSPVYGTPLHRQNTGTPKSQMGVVPGHQSTPQTRNSWTPQNAVHNPFEEDLLDRLHRPVFSPGMFAITSTPGSSEKSPKEFLWSIEQKAILYPADLDEMPHQNDIIGIMHDKETEEKAQRAIDAFFSQSVIAPSPLSDGITKSRSKLTDPANSDHECEEDSPMVFRAPAKTPATEVTPSRSPPKPSKQEVACQTVLSVPAEVDLQKILAEYYTHKEDEEMNSELSNSSLRRKLFFQGEWSAPVSPVRNHRPHGKYSDPNGYEMSPPISPVKCATPEHKTNTIPTPGSNQFSSSPIAFGKGHMTPSLRRCSTAPDLIGSPELSPIGSSASKSVKGQLGQESESMRTPVCRLFQCTPSTGRSILRLDSPGMSPIVSQNFPRFTCGDSQPVSNSGISSNLSRACSDVLSHNRQGEPPELRASAPGGLPSFNMSDISAHESVTDMSVDMDRDSALHSRPCDAVQSQRKFLQSSNCVCKPDFTSEASLGFDSQEYAMSQDTGYNTNSLQLTNQETACSTSSANQEGIQHSNLTNQFGNLPMLGQDTSMEHPDTGDSSGSFLGYNASPVVNIPKHKNSKSNFAMAADPDVLSGQYFDRDLLRSAKQIRMQSLTSQEFFTKNPSVPSRRVKLFSNKSGNAHETCDTS